MPTLQHWILRESDVFEVDTIAVYAAFAHRVELCTVAHGGHRSHNFGPSDDEEWMGIGEYKAPFIFGISD